jgi:restriction endonuclease S subunit
MKRYDSYKDSGVEWIGEIPIPPLSEQQQIVSFLDTKTSLIDSLIEKTQRKIELLKEKRTSLINEVVTKGLNPNVEMKDSGVEWIGEIPSHWEEQQQIVEYLDEQTQLIDKTISIEEKRIELLKEYRQSLISEVVTGKRKVV